MDYKDFKTEIWSIMYTIKCSMRKIFEPLVQSTGLTIIQSFILFAIAESNITTISGVCKELGLNQGNVSTMCKNMEKEGIITRKRDNTDERIVRISLTEQGEEAVSQLKGAFSMFDSVLLNVPAEKLKVIIAGMHELNDVVKMLSEHIK